MPGLQDPWDALKRFSTFAGNTLYRHDPVLVARYAGVTQTLWVGPVAGGTPSVTIGREESNDREVWSNVGSWPLVFTVTGEVTLSAPISKAWMRVVVGLAGTSGAVTCAMTGFLERREQ